MKFSRLSISLILLFSLALFLQKTALAQRQSSIPDRTLAQFQKSQPESAEDYFNRGIIYFEQGKYDLALANYDQAIEINSKNAKAYYNRGNIYFQQGKNNLALAEFSQAIKANPNHAKAYANRGIVYYQQRRDTLARVDWESAKQLFQAQGDIASVKEIDGFLRSLP